MLLGSEDREGTKDDLREDGSKVGVLEEGAGEGLRSGANGSRPYALARPA